MSLHKTRGIVLRYIKYRETSIITHIFTEEFGLQAYVVNGIRNKKAKLKIALFQPPALLDLVVYHRPGADINRLSEVKNAYPYHSIPFDVKKSTICLFITEVLNKVVKEESQVESTFEFVFHSLLTLDNLVTNYENFHLQFLLKLTRYMGFDALASREFMVLHPELSTLATSSFGSTLLLSNAKRWELLQQVIQYFKSHVDTLGEIRSDKIIRDVFHK